MLISDWSSDVCSSDLLLGGVDFSNIFVTLSGGEYASLEEAKAAGAATWNIGLFINTMIDFLIIAFAIFLVVKAINRMKRKEEAAPPSEKPCPYCVTSIPDRKSTRLNSSH